MAGSRWPKQVLPHVTACVTGSVVSEVAVQHASMKMLNLTARWSRPQKALVYLALPYVATCCGSAFSNSETSGYQEPVGVIA